jgi:hypothetical protein
MMVWLILSFIWAALLLFMIFFPKRWASIVEKENSFWVKKGIIKAKTAEKIAIFEKGKGLKILVGIGMLGFFLLVYLYTVLEI